MFGRIDNSIKNSISLLDAFMQLNNPNWKLILYGNTYIDISKYLQYTNIQFKGFCFNKELIYSDVSFLCIPSLYEGMPNVVLEALNHHIPVVGNIACSGVNELIINKYNGLLYTDLYSILDDIMNNSNDIYALRKNCQQSILQYDMESIHQIWYSNIKELIYKKNNTILDELYA